jgi:cytochrome c553
MHEERASGDYRRVPECRLARLATTAVVVGVLLLASPPASAQGAAHFRPKDETPEQYPAGPNREHAFYFCTACHGFRIVAAQGMSRARWDESLTWMTERHNMPKLDGHEREKILDYLETAFPERQRAPGGWRSPFAPQ